MRRSLGAPRTVPTMRVTLLFSDIVDSTALTERLGDWRWLELLSAHDTLVRTQVTEHGGIEVKTRGDGFMLAFANPVGAVHCAAAVQRAVASLNDGLADAELRVRIGVHTCQAIYYRGDYVGKDVALAARICDAAGGGEILVSAQLRQLVEPATALGFEPGRAASLKGLAGHHVLFGVRWSRAPVRRPVALAA
jgi:adenylate cyclase